MSDAADKGGLFMKKLLAFAAALTACLLPLAFTGCGQREEPGTYIVGAELSCYIPAMGGVEFGKPLLTGAEYTLEEDGGMSMTLRFTKSSVTIYSITCDTFIDPSPDSGEIPEEGAPANGTIGYYDDDGALVTEGVTYTLSGDTALNPAGESVHFVDSITFPIEEKKDTYLLTFFINSNVMGVQFTDAGYPATVTVHWDEMQEAGA